MFRKKVFNFCLLCLFFVAASCQGNGKEPPKPDKPDEKKDIKITSVMLQNKTVEKASVQEVNNTEADLVINFENAYTGLTVKVNDESATISGKMATFKITNITEAEMDVKIVATATGYKEEKFNFKVKKEANVAMEANGKVPRMYDLRKKNAVTPIKNQYKDGGCRSFATLAALESHIKLKENVELDLSENNMEIRHGFYFGTNHRRQGRNRNSDIPYLINGLGPILESDDSYTPMKDKNGQKPEYLTQDQVDNLPVVKDKPRQRLVMGFEFLKKIDTKALTSEEDEALLQLKTAIKENGAVVANIYMSHDGHGTFPYSNAKYYNSTNYAYYADGKDGEYATKYKSTANHAIAIVGWNDDFKKDKFTTQPPIDGAWICKDAQTEEFVDRGYFYVSFASVSMGDDAYVFTDVRKGNEYDGIYQHDEVAFSGFMSSDFFAPGNKTVLFNRYEVKEENQVLKEIGFYTTKPNAEYEVYLVPDFEAFKVLANKEDDIDEFYKFIQQYKIFSGTEEKAGYHTKKLEAKDLNLTKGKAFALGIWCKNSNAEDSDHKFDMPIDEKKPNGFGQNSIVNKNETFTWDSSDNELIDINKMGTTGNACIKGYFKIK